MDAKQNISFEFQINNAKENNFLKSLLDDIAIKQQEKFDDYLTEYLRENLIQFNISFNSKQDFYDFMMNEVDVIKFPNGRIELYFTDKILKSKTLFGVYNDNIDHNWSNSNTINTTFG